MLSVNRLFIEKEQGENTRWHYGVEIECRGVQRGVKVTEMTPKPVDQPDWIPFGESHKVTLFTGLEGNPIRLVPCEIVVSYEWATPHGLQKGQLSARIILPELVGE